MSRTTKTTTTDNRPLPVVTTATPDTSDTSPVTAETKVHDALRDNPGTTTAKLALAAGVGRSTASKILARWATERTVIRTAGKDQRTPVTWTIHDTIEADGGNTPAEAAPNDSAAASGDDDTTPTDAPPSGTDAEPADNENPTQITTNGDDSSPEQDTAPDDTSTITNVVAQPPTVDADQGVEPSPQGASAATTKDRLPKGGLYKLVKTYLADHPDDSFGPAKIGTNLGRSGGEVNNALDKLVTDGHAVKTCEAPKRFTSKIDTE